MLQTEFIVEGKASESTRGSRGRIRASSLVLGLIPIVLAAVLAVRNVSTWPARISYPGEESYEGSALVEAARLAQGVPIYAPASPEGFSEATYGPLYYLVGSRLIDLRHPSYFPLRLLSAIAILGCAFGCGLLAFWVTRNRWAALFAPPVFLSYGIVTFHGVSALSDNVALLLMFASFLVAYRFRYTRAILWAAPLMVLGFYYKQQFIAGPLAVFVFLLLERRYALAAQFAGLLGVLGLGSLALFQWLVFRRQEFWRHFLFYQSPLYSWHQFGIGALAFTLMLGGPALLAWQFLREHPDRMMTCYLACAVFLGLATIGKEAGFIHYFYETILLVSALVPGLLLSRIDHRSGIVEIAVLLVIGLIGGQWYTPRPPTAADWAQYTAEQSFLRGKFPPHSRALGYRAGDLFQAGFDTPFDTLYQTELLARYGIVSDRYLQERIKQHWFRFIVLDFDLSTEHDPTLLNYYLTQETRAAIEQNYRVVSNIRVPGPEQFLSLDHFYIYEPRGDSDTAGSPIAADSKQRVLK